jgi:UPF0271 protein
VAYVKPHGALYNAIVRHRAQADAVADALVAHGGTLPLMGLPGSAIESAAGQRGLRFVAEGFADRGYMPDGTLVPRNQPGALLTDAAAVAAQTESLVARGVQSICVHSDTPGAAALAEAVRATMVRLGSGPAAFT